MYSRSGRFYDKIYSLKEYQGEAQRLVSLIGRDLRSVDIRLPDMACGTGRHVVPGGLVIIEPWFTPETWQPGTVHARFIDEPDFKFARVNTSRTEGWLSCMDMHYLIGMPEGTGHFVGRHELGMFEIHEMKAAFQAGRTRGPVRRDRIGGTGTLSEEKAPSVKAKNSFAHSGLKGVGFPNPGASPRVVDPATAGLLSVALTGLRSFLPLPALAGTGEDRRAVSGVNP